MTNQEADLVEILYQTHKLTDEEFRSVLNTLITNPTVAPAIRTAYELPADNNDIYRTTC